MLLELAEPAVAGTVVLLMASASVIAARAPVQRCHRSSGNLAGSCLVGSLAAVVLTAGAIAEKAFRSVQLQDAVLKIFLVRP